MNLTKILTIVSRPFHNSDGIVLVTVTIIIIVMTMLALSILGLNVNQIMTLESEAERIQAETLALGVLNYQQAFMEANPLATSFNFSENLDGKNFNVNANRIAQNVFPRSDEWDLAISY